MSTPLVPMLRLRVPMPVKSTCLTTGPRIDALETADKAREAAVDVVVTVVATELAVEPAREAAVEVSSTSVAVDAAREPAFEAAVETSVRREA